MSEDDRTSYEEMESIIFGMDPGDWAAILHQKLTASSIRIANARALSDDANRDITEESTAADLANVRHNVSQYLSELYLTLCAMPLMQSSPTALDGLRFIATCLADVERGAAPLWLLAKPTKRHPTKLAELSDWAMIIECVELARLKPGSASVDAASKEIAKMSGRAVGTIKDWHRRIMSPTDCKYPAAQSSIRESLTETKARLMFAVVDRSRAASLDRLIRDRLPKPL